MPFLDHNGAGTMGSFRGREAECAYRERNAHAQDQSTLPNTWQRKDCPSQRETPRSSRWNDSRPGKGESVPVTTASGDAVSGSFESKDCVSTTKNEQVVPGMVAPTFSPSIQEVDEGRSL